MYHTYVAIVNVLFILLSLCRKKISPSANVAYILIESTKQEFMNHYNIRLNVIVYFSILSVIPHRWKLLIRGIGKLDSTENDIAM